MAFPVPAPTPEEREIQLYRQCVQTYGRTSRGLGYTSTESHLSRFSYLVRIEDFTSKSVTDVGCGFGDLLDFIPNIRQYYGYERETEILKLVPADRVKNPKTKWFHQDYFDLESAPRTDIAVCLGPCQFVESPAELRRRLNIMVQLHNVTYFNMTSPFMPRGSTAKWSWEDLLQVVRSVTRRFNVYHDYHESDMMIKLAR